MPLLAGLLECRASIDFTKQKNDEAFNIPFGVIKLQHNVPLCAVRAPAVFPQVLDRHLGFPGALHIVFFVTQQPPLGREFAPPEKMNFTMELCIL